MNVRRELSMVSLVLLLAAPAVAENWPQWRGPHGNSRSDETNLPLVWNENAGVKWKTELPGWGTSTPAVWGDAVLVTTQDEDRLLLLRISKRTGDVVWTRQVGTGEVTRDAERGAQKFHRLHNLASPSPVTDGDVVVAHFGNGDLACFTLKGERLWQRNLQTDYGNYTIWWGHANSPVLHGGSVISVCMQDSLSDLQDKPVPSYLVAHDLRTGRVLWYQPRMTEADKEECDSYTTPLLLNTADRTELLLMGGNQLDAYDPATGKQIWKLPGLQGGRTITGPTLSDGVVYTTRGMRGPMVALRVAGETPAPRGELQRRDLLWEYSQGTPDSCCPVVWADLVFTVTDDGIARCFNAPTGHLKWTRRLKGRYKASPLAAAGRVYFLNEDGLCTVISAAPRFDKLTENQLDDETSASPAASDGMLFIRGKQRLYCLSR